MTVWVKAIMNRVKGINTKMNMIVSLMAAGTRKRFSREEYRRIREEANALFQKLTEDNKDLPKAMKKHTGTIIFPAIAVYKTLLAHGLTTDEASGTVYRNLRGIQTGILCHDSLYRDFYDEASGRSREAVDDTPED